MDDPSLKRTTDCVYFLASPLTCKKGVECEYRHSEAARLNPRDCWYWLAGNCQHPICGFRHPPLDIHTKAVKSPAEAEAQTLPDKSSFPHSKNNVTCYFYFNGRCNKGDKCSYLHGSDDASALKQKDSAVVVAPSVDGRIPPDSFNHIVAAEAKLLNDKLPAGIEAVLDPPEIFSGSPKTAKEEPLPWKKLVELPSILGPKDSSHSLVYVYDEAPSTMSDSLNASGNVDKSGPSICSDQCSKETVGNGAEDEWKESSTGYDVLSGGSSDSINAEEDMLRYEDCYDNADEDHDSHFLAHGYKDQKAYGGRFLREKRIHAPAYYSDGEYIPDLVGYSGSDGGTNHVLSQKRKLRNAGLTVGGRCDVDLRDHLAKRRCLADRLERHAERFPFRRCNLPFQSKERQGRSSPQSRTLNGRLPGRFASRLERNGISLPMEKFAFIVPKHRRQARNSRCSRRTQYLEQKRQTISFNVPRTTLSGRKGESEVTVSFTGPKTLAQIREEKCRAKADAAQLSGEVKPVNFQAKPFD